jgi:hypothetical protein
VLDTGLGAFAPWSAARKAQPRVKHGATERVQHEAAHSPRFSNKSKNK